MSLDHLPANLEADVKQFASRQHLTVDEAVIKLIQTGLEIAKPKSRIRGLGKTPMSESEAAVVDEALSIAMEARRARAEKVLGA